MAESTDEGERRAPRRGSLTLAQILAVFERDRDRHVMAGAASEAELARLESALGCRIPEGLRAFLSRFGGGLFYNGHEVFGPTRTMVHDIELVPDMLSVRHRLAEEGSLPQGFLPFHRARGVVNLIDAREAVGTGEIVPLSQSPPHPDLASFLETVVLPRA
jgi:SMI1/KNR4 family protein SUKH-1